MYADKSDSYALLLRSLSVGCEITILWPDENLFDKNWQNIALKSVKLGTRITQNVPLMYHSIKNGVLNTSGRNRNVPQPNRDLKINLYKIRTNIGNKGNKGRNKNEFLCTEKKNIVLRIIVGLVLRGIFSQTLCWFKVRCDAPSTKNATSLRLHPTWDNLNSWKFPSSAGRSTAENSGVDSGRTRGRERWPEVGHPTGHRRRVPVLGKYSYNNTTSVDFQKKNDT